MLHDYLKINITHILDQDQLLHTTMEPVAGVEEVGVAEVGVEEADVEEVVGVEDEIEE